MLKMNEDNHPPPASTANDSGDEPSYSMSVSSPAPVFNGESQSKEKTSFSFSGFIKDLISKRQDTSLREAIEEYIETPEDEAIGDSVAQHEKALFSNILKLRDLPVTKLMIPRADIVAVDVNTPVPELLSILAEKQSSRVPVYQNTLDEILGTIHLKDIIGAIAHGEEIVIRNLITEVPIISPSMPALDLLLTMRETRRHMAMVVDEYGGIDGLVTIGDVIESIVGEIDDEHDDEDTPQIRTLKDGSLIADGRVYLEDFEASYGQFFSEEEHEETETLAGIIFMIAGRIPGRGEIITHSSGLVFEVLDADQRSIRHIKIYYPGE